MAPPSQAQQEKKKSQGMMSSSLHAAILSDKQIVEEIKNGNIVCRPFKSENLQNCSMDVTLGEHFYRFNPKIGFVCPWTKQKLWIEGKCDVATQGNKYSLKDGTRYILLHPKENILCHTQEFIGTTKNLTTMLKARSSMGRNNITICRDAGWGDVGYFNRYTLEITNNNNVPLVLPIGIRIGQIVFLRTGETDRVYDGKYQNTHDINELMNKWTPEEMLPQSFNDVENIKN